MILKDLEIPSSTVLAVYNDTIVPHSSIISEDISIELIVVSSGG
jgi:sulfur carrier protein ThiS